MEKIYTYDNAELLQRFRAGDDDAFTRIFDQFYFIIYQYAKRWLQDKQDAEDITADTFLKLLQRREQMASLENIAAFLKLAARNACLNFLKHQKVKADKQSELIRQLSAISEPDFAWLEIREEFLRMIYTEVDKMPPKMREVFLLAYKDGLKPAEIAEELGLSVQTVSNHKSNALKLLKLALSNKAMLATFLYFLD